MRKMLSLPHHFQKQLKSQAHVQRNKSATFANIIGLQYCAAAFGFLKKEGYSIKIIFFSKWKFKSISASKTNLTLFLMEISVLVKISSQKQLKTSSKNRRGQKENRAFLLRQN